MADEFLVPMQISRYRLGLQADFDLEAHARSHPGALESIRPLDAGA